MKQLAPNAAMMAALRSKRLQDLLIKRAQIDPLTELSNRGALRDHLEREWSRKERHGNSVAFIMCDLDHFKGVNDRYGHPAGDKVLFEVAAAIRESCRTSDFPARYGGEEFAIVATEQDAQGAACFAERLRQTISAIRVEAGKDAIQVTASFGVADTEGLTSYEDLIRIADEAMYRAKSNGRNRVELASGAGCKRG